ncbi:hypothetical protein RND81_11G100200 [Saponaria officinalis]|uniref:Uncharacterized protein n=1 Tax=Saponaria officinalis TaxID=3572 RepID=A0AAW1HK68_SAPOF
MAPLATSNTDITEDVHQILQAQSDIMNRCCGFVDSLAIRSAVELHIPDIIHSHGHPMTVSEIASKVDSTSSPNIPSLARLMRVLAFSPMFLALTHPATLVPWNEISRSIKEGGTPFEIAYEPEFNDMFNSGMASKTQKVMKAILKGYKEGFWTGSALAEIVKAHPHMNGINFDLPHAVTTAQPFPDVTHVIGDMFTDIPKGDTILLKTVIHDWGGENCVKILQNFIRAISEKRGKVIIVDIVLQSDGKETFEGAKMTLELLMMTFFNGGKERSEIEWKKLLNEAGFFRYNIIQIPALVSITEIFPQ